MKYNPETYWSEVGKRIAAREDSEKNVIAGDDEPYYRYKREKFLQLLRGVDFESKSVLELGSGPGGNLLEVLPSNPSRLVGADISEEMVQLARQKVPENVEIIKVNGTVLPFKDREFDITFTATVLQHNTDEKMLRQVIRELCRVTEEKVVLFERIEDRITGDELCIGRPVDYYESLMQSNGFELRSKKFINIRASYYVCGAIRKGLNRRDRKEGESLNKTSQYLQNLALPLTSSLDRLLTSNKDLARLEFLRVE